MYSFSHKFEYMEIACKIFCILFYYRNKKIIFIINWSFFKVFFSSRFCAILYDIVLLFVFFSPKAGLRKFKNQIFAFLYQFIWLNKYFRNQVLRAMQVNYDQCKEKQIEQCTLNFSKISISAVILIVFQIDILNWLLFLSNFVFWRYLQKNNLKKYRITLFLIRLLFITIKVQLKTKFLTLKLGFNIKKWPINFGTGKSQAKQH